jgi:hypothetical protein
MRMGLIDRSPTLSPQGEREKKKTKAGTFPAFVVDVRSASASDSRSRFRKWKP